MFVYALILTVGCFGAFMMGKRFQEAKIQKALVSRQLHSKDVTGSGLTAQQLQASLLTWVPLFNESTIDITSSLHYYNASNTLTSVTLPNGSTAGTLIVCGNFGPGPVTISGAFRDAVESNFTTVTFHPGQAHGFVWTGATWMSIHTGYG